MIAITDTSVFGWDAAVRGMRAPMNSWDKNDSYWTHIEDAETGQTAKFEFFLGENDLKLMRSLVKGGDDHAKCLRMIHVQADIIAPLYWWKEYDTYKVGTVANSCSTMHKIHTKPIEVSDFSVEFIGTGVSLADMFHGVASHCELLRRKYLETQDKRYWKALVQLLPQGYNQKRTVDINYQVLAHMYFARRSHKLSEWHEFCDWTLTLPYFREIVVQEENDG